MANPHFQNMILWAGHTEATEAKKNQPMFMPYPSDQTFYGYFNDFVSYTASDGEYVYSKYWPSGTVATDIVAYVYDDPYTVFRIQSAGTPAQTDVGACADVVAGTGSTSTGQSGFNLNGTMSNGTATCKIIGIWEDPSNSFAQYAQLEVLINEHLLKATAGI